MPITMNNIIALIAALGIGGLIGNVVTNWLVTKREHAGRRHESRLRELKEFYGPLFSLRQEILARSELRVKVQEAVDRMHMQAMLQADPAHVDEVSDLHVPGVLQTIRDENQTFREVL